jgi:hypothetical protein
MKSGELDFSPLRPVLVRGVRIIVKRLTEVAEPTAEAISCIRSVQALVKSGELTDPSEIADAIRDQIRIRNRPREVVTDVFAGSPVSAALTLAVAGLSERDRSAARMYYVEAFGEHAICSRLCISSKQFRRTLAQLRSLRRTRPNAGGERRCRRCCLKSDPNMVRIICWGGEEELTGENSGLFVFLDQPPQSWMRIGIFCEKPTRRWRREDLSRNPQLCRNPAFNF